MTILIPIALPHSKITSIEQNAVQSVHYCLHILFAGHVDEAETFRAAGFSVLDDGDVEDGGGAGDEFG